MLSYINNENHVLRASARLAMSYICMENGFYSNKTTRLSYNSNINRYRRACNLSFIYLLQPKPYFKANNTKKSEILMPTVLILSMKARRMNFLPFLVMQRAYRDPSLSSNFSYSLCVAFRIKRIFYVRNYVIILILRDFQNKSKIC